MEILSRLGVNEIPVDIKDGVTEPYNIPAGIDEGTFRMTFRTEEIDILNQPKSKGIPVEMLGTRFYDGNRQLARCKTENGTEIEILVSNKVGHQFVFAPKNPIFFPAEEDEEF